MSWWSHMVVVFRVVHGLWKVKIYPWFHLMISQTLESQTRWAKHFAASTSLCLRFYHHNKSGYKIGLKLITVCLHLRVSKRRKVMSPNYTLNMCDDLIHVVWRCNLILGWVASEHQLFCCFHVDDSKSFRPIRRLEEINISIHVHVFLRCVITLVQHESCIPDALFACLLFERYSRRIADILMKLSHSNL